MTDTDQVDTHGSGIDEWRGDLAGDGNPLVTNNATAANLTIYGVLHPVGQLIQHPGPDGEDSVVRWTAPADGSVTVQAIFTGEDSVGGTTTDVHVLHDSIDIFDGNVTGFGNVASFSAPSFRVAKGDTIDFAVGYGSDGGFAFDSTATDLTVVFSRLPAPTAHVSTAVGASLEGVKFSRNLDLATITGSTVSASKGLNADPAADHDQITVITGLKPASVHLLALRSRYTAARETIRSALARFGFGSALSVDAGKGVPPPGP